VKESFVIWCVTGVFTTDMMLKGTRVVSLGCIGVQVTSVLLRVFVVQEMETAMMKDQKKKLTAKVEKFTALPITALIRCYSSGCVVW